MGLQVRVRHALGERLVDLPDRTADNPLVVGRSKDADVKIPAVTVASRHSALFVHEGRWVMQDLSKGATHLNGKPTQGPTPLSVGDVLKLGNDANPATIEIDPAGAAAGHTGEPALAGEPIPAPRARNTPAPRVAAETQRIAPGKPRVMPTAQRPPQVQASSAPRAMPPQIVRKAIPAHVTTPGEQSGATEVPADDPFAGWQPPAPGQGDAAILRRRKKKPSAVVGWIAGIILCALIVAGTNWAVRYEKHQASAQSSEQARALASSGSKRTGNIFTGSDAAEPPPAASRPAKSGGGFMDVKPTSKPIGDREDGTSDAPPVIPPTDPSAANRSSPDAAPQTDEQKRDGGVWNDVLGATYSPEIGQAILKFDDYRRQHPGVATKELDDFTEQAMDRLWWKRIAQLCARRESRKQQLRDKDKDIKEQPEGVFRKTLVTERKVIQDDLDRTLQRLAGDMGYTNSETLDLDNKDMITKLTGERDAGKYGAWKISTLKYIRNSHGATPWDGES